MSVIQHNQRLDVRLSAELKDLIQQAADFQGQTISAFTVSVLAEEARRVVDKHTTIRMASQDRDKFLALLENPPEPNAALRRAAEKHRETVSR